MILVITTQIEVMRQKQHRISISVSKELFEQLEERAKKEVRTPGNLGLYLLLLGLEYEKVKNSEQVSR